MSDSKKKVLIAGAGGLINGLVLNAPEGESDFSALKRRPLGGIR